eukprot:4340672-Prymnesium_polylepis.1
MVRGVGGGMAGQQRARLTRDARAPQAAMQCPGALNAPEEQEDVEVPLRARSVGPEWSGSPPRAMAVGVGARLLRHGRAREAREGDIGLGWGWGVQRWPTSYRGYRWAGGLLSPPYTTLAR